MDRSTKSPCDIMKTSAEVKDYMRIGYKKPDPNLLAIEAPKTVTRENKIIAPPPKPKAIEPEKKPEATFLTGAPIKEVDEEEEEKEKEQEKKENEDKQDNKEETNKFLDGINKELEQLDDQGFHDIGKAENDSYVDEHAA